MNIKKHKHTIDTIRRLKESNRSTWINICENILFPIVIQGIQMTPMSIDCKIKHDTSMCASPMPDEEFSNVYNTAQKELMNIISRDIHSRQVQFARFQKLSSTMQKHNFQVQLQFITRTLLSMFDPLLKGSKETIPQELIDKITQKCSTFEKIMLIYWLFKFDKHAETRCQESNERLRRMLLLTSLLSMLNQEYFEV